MYKQYELTVDLLNCKIGTVLTHTGENWYETKAGACMPADIVENNPSWFKEIKIEDKESTAFQWSDELVWEFGVEIKQGYSEEWISSRMASFKERKKLSQSIPAGTGTANETINDNVGKFRDSYSFSDNGLFTTTIPDNPVLDRQDREGSVNGASAEYGGYGLGSGGIGGTSLRPTDIPTLDRNKKYIERWDLKWEDGRAVLNRNDDGKWRLVEYNDCNGFWYSEKKYEEDLKKAFEAGRQSIGPVNYDRNGFKFPTFQDYKLSKLKSNDSR